MTFRRITGSAGIRASKTGGHSLRGRFLEEGWLGEWRDGHLRVMPRQLLKIVSIVKKVVDWAS